MRRVFGKVLKRRTTRRLEERQSGQEYPPLKCGIVWHAERTSQFKGHPQCSGRLRLLRMQPDKADLGCRQSLFFEEMGEHADGARAQGSDRYQQDGIDLILDHQMSNAASLILQGHRVVRSHEGIAVAGNAADGAIFG